MAAELAVEENVLEMTIGLTTEARRAVRRRGRLLAVLAGLATAASLAAHPAPVSAAAYGDDFGITPGSFFAGTCSLPDRAPAAPGVADWHCDSSNPAVTQAGAHPDATASFELKPVTTFPGALPPYPDGNVRDVVADLPPGLVGNPRATPQCPQARFVVGDCPVETQVGVVTLRLGSSPTNPNASACLSVPSVPNPTTFPWFQRGVAPAGPLCHFPIWNIPAAGGQTAAFGFMYSNTLGIELSASIRPDDYGIRVMARQVNQSPALSLSRVTLWGVPGDPKHDPFRWRNRSAAAPLLPPGQDWPSTVPIVPFLSNPTSCDGSQPVTTLRVRSWQHPDVWDTATYSSPPVTGCDQVPFDPSMGVSLDTRKVDSPVGLTVDLGFPQDGLSDINKLATSHLRKAKVTLPEGMTINPSAADGLTACTDAQISWKTDDPVQCPNASRIGTAWAMTPVLKEQLGGGIYVGSQLSDDPQSGQMFRIFLVLGNEDRGIRVKLPGQIRVDPNTGRIEATFDNNPQLPVETIRVSFKGGPRAPLASPPDCGVKQVVAQLDSWSGQTKYLAQPVAFDCPGLQGFAPSFMAGSADATGGGYSPFSVQFDRADGQQYLKDVKVEMPTGLLAKLDGVPLCSDADADAGTCDQSSRVGDAIAGAGVGSNPFFLTGGVYMTGPYKGAPFGLAVMVPAVAGPFNLGKVIVRQQIQVDATDAHITVVSDPLPQIVRGVPVRLRSVNVDVNRPGFMINPTDCSEKQIKATLGSANGESVELSQRFQASGCANLPLDPKLDMTLSDPTQTTDGKHPGLRAILTQTPGQSNIKKVEVRLPLSMALDPDNAQALCKPEEARAKACPETSIVGHATAWTPILHEPLDGPVYFVEGLRTTATGQIRRTLPKLWVALRGAVALDVWADSDVDAQQRLVNTFATVPDAPISQFQLDIDGGSHGILVLNTDICQRGQVAEDFIDGHNGKRVEGNVNMTTPCAQAASKNKKKGKAHVRITGRHVTGSKVVVRGKVNRAASRKLKVTVACQRARHSVAVAPRGGSWKARLPLVGSCATARTMKVTASYKGGPEVARGSAHRAYRS
jgi:hypothetical protein